MMSESSAAFNRFKVHLDGGIRRKRDLESLDLASLSAIRPDEIPAAEALLVGRLDAGKEDPRVVDALMTLGTVSAWEAIARAATGAAPPITQMRAMRRLAQQGRNHVGANEWAELAERYDQGVAASEWVAGLFELANPSADAVLLDRLRRTETIRVRTLVIEALWRRYRFPTQAGNTSAAWILRLGLTSRWPSVRADACRELERVMEQIQAGETLEALEIAARGEPESDLLKQFRTTREDAAAAYDLAQVNKLKDKERAWAVDLLLRSLYSGDARAEGALEILGGTRAALGLSDWRAGRIASLS